MRAIGEDMTQDWILRGRDWLESCQNDDGGWGETCAHLRKSVDQRKRRKHGFANGLGVDGICACGDLDRPSVQRGLRYLLSRRNNPMARGTSRKSPAPVSRRVLFEVRHVSAELSAARARHLRQLPQRSRASFRVFIAAIVSGETTGR